MAGSDSRPGSSQGTQAASRAFDTIRTSLSLPLIAAPMYLISGTALVCAAARTGIIGAFPTVNCKTPEQLDQWLREIEDDAKRFEDETGHAAAPYCPNLIVHKSNPRVFADLEVLAKHNPKVVITSVGTPAPVSRPLHDIGALVLADVGSIEHAKKAISAGADGLVLLTAGAGGQTGWMNPFAFVRAVRQFFPGPIVLAGGMTDGRSLLAAEVLGCDLAYMGTMCIATAESMATPEYKRMLVESDADDVMLTRAFTGLQTNMLRPSIVAAGLDPDALPERGALDVSRDISIEGRDNRPQRWKDIWSAGHSVSGVADVPPLAALVERVRIDYRAAIAELG